MSVEWDALQAVLSLAPRPHFYVSHQLCTIRISQIVTRRGSTYGAMCEHRLSRLLVFPQTWRRLKFLYRCR